MISHGNSLMNQQARGSYQYNTTTQVATFWAALSENWLFTSPWDTVATASVTSTSVSIRIPITSETVQTSLVLPIKACQFTLLTTYSLLRWCLTAETRVWQPPCDTFCLLWCSRTVFSAPCKKTSKGHCFYTVGHSLKPWFNGKEVQKNNHFCTTKC